MSTLDWSLMAANMLLVAGVAWLIGFDCGRRDMRRQVVKSLRFGASLRRTLSGSHAEAKAEALDAAADRFERGGA